MFKKLYNKLFKNKKSENDSRIKNLTKLNQALYPSDNLKVIYEEITEYEIKGVTYKLGDRVICRTNECNPLMVATIVEFWDNDGKWSNCIPQVKDELDGQVWSHMGTIVHHTEELMAVLVPMRPLEQWNHLLPDNVKDMYSYTEEQMDKKEKQYNSVQNIKKKMA